MIAPRLTEYRTEDTGSHRLTTEDWGVGQETEEIHASNDGEGGGPRRVTQSEARRGEERRGSEARRMMTDDECHPSLQERRSASRCGPTFPSPFLRSSPLVRRATFSSLVAPSTRNRPGTIFRAWLG